MRWQRRNHRAAFKARVAHEAIRGEETLTELVQKHGARASNIAGRKSEFVQGTAGVLDDGEAKSEQKIAFNRTHAEIDQLTLEQDFLEIALSKVGSLEGRL